MKKQKTFYKSFLYNKRKRNNNKKTCVKRYLWLYLHDFCFLMAEEKNKLLIDLEVRVKQLMFLCDALREENEVLKSEIQSKDLKLGKLTEELNSLKTKYDSLKVARTITAATVDVDTAKVKLSTLVRKVDKCIDLLNS